jgi:gliding motility-associated-like protein
MSTVTITIPPFTIATAVMTSAPAAYPQTMPYDVTAFINSDSELVLDPLITGNYVVHLVDTCGNEYDAEFFVPTSTAGNISSSNWPDCSSGNGSIRIAGNGTQILYVEMTSAPSTFSQSIPLDVSYNIFSGTFSMDDLPPGDYTFLVNDSCGVTHPNVPITVIAYTVNGNDITQTPHCGSFDLNVFHASTGISEDFWLQKYFPALSAWGHPETEVLYVEGTIPNGLNSYSILNNTTTYNLGYLGSFRVLKVLESFESGNQGTTTKSCIETIAEFDFNDGFEIIEIEKLTCDGQNTDVAIITNGVPPLTFKIKSKNGDTSFVIDNGNNNVFVGLEVAVYEFEVQHACGHIRNIVTDIGALPSPVIVPEPGSMPDMIVCDDVSNDGISDFMLTAQDAIILGSQNPVNYTISYHLTSADANVGSNALPNIYSSPTGTIYVRLQRNATDCFEVTSFDLVVNPFPILEMLTEVGLCPGESVTISADPGFSSYLWSTGATSQSIIVNIPGDYTLTVSNGSCETSVTVTVEPAEPPVLNSISIKDWTDDENSLTVNLQNPGSGHYLFSLDNVNFQQENIFHSLLPGLYTVYIKEASGCGAMEQEVYILMYHKYFTPNGDGTHDFWRIKLSELEPHFKTYVFDRYGKLITGFMPDSAGWDGTLNGELLPSTDYWFVVVRENGKELRGHFAMKR